MDVLTLTATPIPRTLHMSLTGRARHEHHRDAAARTGCRSRPRVAEYDDELIRQAILRELNRGGQVFFVHNRVQDIEPMAERAAAARARGAASPSATARCPSASWSG